MSEGRTIPFVRVPGHDHAAIGYAIDCGASIVVPQVDTVAQAAHVVSAAKFGSKYNGTRSAPPFRLIPGLTDTVVDPSLKGGIHENWNHQAAIIIQIESLKGIENLDAILTEVPDIDAVWLGTLDARVSMNLPANMYGPHDEPEWQAALAKYKETVRKHNKPFAGFALGPNSKAMGQGMSFIMCAADVAQLMGLSGRLQECQEMFGKVTREVYLGVEKNGFKADGRHEVVENGGKAQVKTNGS